MTQSVKKLHAIFNRRVHQSVHQNLLPIRFFIPVPRSNSPQHRFQNFIEIRLYALPVDPESRVRARRKIYSSTAVYVCKWRASTGAIRSLASQVMKFDWKLTTGLGTHRAREYGSDAARRLDRAHQRKGVGEGCEGARLWRPIRHTGRHNVTHS